MELSNVGSGGLSRREGMRCLVSCLSGLIKVAARHTTVQDPHRDGESNKKRSTSPGSVAADVHRQPERGASVSSVGGRRNLISPETWQETLAILVEADYGLRAEYARTLAMFINSEIPQETTLSVEGSSDRGSVHKSTVTASGSDETIRFLHAMHATVYTLVVAPTLGLNAAASVTLDNTASASTSSEMSPVTPVTPMTTQSSADTFTTTTSTSMTVQLNFVDSTPTQSPIAEEQTPPSTLSVSGGQKTSIASGSVQDRHAHRPRTTSLALSLMDPIESSGTQLIFPAPAPACPNDYSHAVAIVSSAVQRTPAKAILTGVPMLLALDKLSCAPLVSSGDGPLRGRRQAMREGIAQVWAVIASVIESSELQELSHKVHMPSNLALINQPYSLAGPPISAPVDCPANDLWNPGQLFSAGGAAESVPFGRCAGFSGSRTASGTFGAHHGP